LFNLLQTVPAVRRNVAARLLDKARNRAAAASFGEAYFDGPREQGYGGYRYDGRWVAVSRTAVERYGLAPGHRTLDIGCAKGFFVHDLAQVVPGLEAWGLDVSAYALAHAHPGAAGRLVRGDARALPFPDGAFDAVFAINTVHNLDRAGCVAALREIGRVARDPRRCFVQVDAYRTPGERELFEAWMLTARTYCMPEEWEALFAEAGYQGDCYWTILQPELSD
jgi:SAM-dependent methyltransferase